MDLDALLSQPFTADHARRAGLTDDQLRWLCTQGVVTQVLHGVYLGTHVDPDLATRAAAVGLVLPPGAAVCRRTAAYLHGVDLRVPGEPPLPVEIVVPSGMTPPRRAGVLSYQADLPAGDIALVRQVSVTTGLRTAVDLARFRPRIEAVVAVDMLSHAGLCTIEEVASVIPLLAGRRGIRQLAEVVSLANARSESQMETRLRLVIVDGGWPSPVVQWPVVDAYGVVLARLDLAYPEKLIGVEYDGWRDHTRKPQFDHDRDRQNTILELQEWRLRRYVDRHVFRTPTLIVRQIGKLLAA